MAVLTSRKADTVYAPFPNNLWHNSRGKGKASNDGDWLYSFLTTTLMMMVRCLELLYTVPTTSAERWLLSNNMILRCISVEINFTITVCRITHYPNRLCTAGQGVFLLQIFFTAQRYCKVCICCGVSVCLSVRLSHSWTVSKQLYLHYIS